MLSLIHSIIYSIVQGLTEFLPVSSSGHLALLQNLLGDVDVQFDIILHLATLIAVLAYFYKDIIEIMRDFFTLKTKSENFRIVLFLIIASIPAAIVGFLLKDMIDSYFSNIIFVACGFVISGMFLFTASYTQNKNTPLTLKNTFVIGLSQALAILPGISRSGSTTSTAFFFGIPKGKALKFSFLLSVPAILGATLLKINHLTLNVNLIIPFILAFLTGLFSIYLFMKVIQIKNLKYFAYYCWFIALLILILKLMGFL